jgi:hypothetical protein
VKPNVKKGLLRIWIVASVIYSVSITIYVYMDFGAYGLGSRFNGIHHRQWKHLQKVELNKARNVFPENMPPTQKRVYEINLYPNGEGSPGEHWEKYYESEVVDPTRPTMPRWYAITEYGAHAEASTRRLELLWKFAWELFPFLVYPQIVILVLIFPIRYIAKGFASTPTNEA